MAHVHRYHHGVAAKRRHHTTSVRRARQVRSRQHLRSQPAAPRRRGCRRGQRIQLQLLLRQRRRRRPPRPGLGVRLLPLVLGRQRASKLRRLSRLAFREAQRLCPYHRQADVMMEGGACSVSFHEVRGLDLVFDDDVDFTAIPGAIEAAPSWWLDKALGRLDGDILFMLLLQATGILCVVLMLLVEWRRHVIS